MPTQYLLMTFILNNPFYYNPHIKFTVIRLSQSSSISKFSFYELAPPNHLSIDLQKNIDISSNNLLSQKK